MDIRNKFILVVSIVICVLFSGKNETITYANNINKPIEESNLSQMQNAFFEIAELKEDNINLLEAEIKSITSKFSHEKTINRSTDKIDVYSFNNEKLSIYTKTSDKGETVEGIIYKIYNPKNDICITRMQYHDFYEEGKYVRLEVTTESIDELDKLLINLENDIIKEELYIDYIKLFNRVDLDKIIITKDLLSINPNFEQIYNKYYEEDPFNHFKVSNNNNQSLNVNINKSRDMINSMEFSYGKKIYKYKNTVITMLKEDMDKETIEYLNLYNNGQWGHTFMIFEDNVKSLKDIYMKYADI